jgi:hypothetical protein
VTSRPSRTERLVSAMLALSFGSLLAVSRWLQPSDAGHSTHLQLGLRPCTFLEFTGYPCPMCGMTTCFAHMADLHIWKALVTQPFGVFLFLISCAVFAISMVEALVPAGRWSRLLDAAGPHENRAAVIFFLGLGGGWLYKIAWMQWW